MKYSEKAALTAGLSAAAAGGMILYQYWKDRKHPERKNLPFQRTEILLSCDGLPQSFDGLRIAQLSDLHGNSLEGLDQAVKEFHPDLIACTGDIFDGVRYGKQTEEELKKLAAIAPVYFVSGNHEYYAGNWKKRQEALRALGIHVLDNQAERIEKNGEAVELCGLSDPDLSAKWSAQERLEQLSKDLKSLPEKKDFRILLFHRADLFDWTAPAQADLTLSGHLHGGHWRFFDQGIIAPKDGSKIALFPRYDAGLYEKDGRRMYVSRGLGDQMVVPRLFNPPELVLMTLKSKSEE